MKRGTITRLVPDPGRGVIAGDDGGPPAVFLRTAVVGVRFEQLREGQRVAYAARVDPMHRQRVWAANVRPVEN